MHNEYSRKRILTNIFFSFYVSCGFLLMIIASLMSTSSLFDVHKDNMISWIVYLVCSIIAGVSTFVLKVRIFRFERLLSENPNIIVREDWLPIGYSFFMVILELTVITFLPEYNLMYSIILMVMIAIIGLNIYFSSFWKLNLKGSGIISNLEALKLEHNEWSTIFNNIFVGSIVVIAGMVFSLFTDYFKLLSGESIYYPFNLYADGILIFHVIILGPIVWLLRPVHIKMAFIRKKIINLNYSK